MDHFRKAEIENAERTGYEAGFTRKEYSNPFDGKDEELARLYEINWYLGHDEGEYYETTT
jgi:hypothetical protein